LFKKKKELDKSKTKQKDPFLHSSVFYLEECDEVLTANIGQKFPHASSRGRQKGTIFKYARALCLLKSLTDGEMP
jgi:hypothetical protein